MDSVSKLKETNPLSRRLEIVRKTSLDDPAIKQALLGLTNKYNANQSMKDLRMSINSQLVSLNDQFLADFEELALEMGEMGSKMDSVRVETQDMKNLLNQAYQDTDYIIKTTEELNQKLQENQIKQKIAAAFISKFSLSKKQQEILTSSEYSVNSEFFEAMSRLQEIHSDCAVLLGADEQNLGLTIMQSIDTIQETAYTRMLNWTRRECRMMRFESPEVSIELRQAMHAFRLRPLLFDSCIEEITTIRQIALEQAFIEALTVGGPGGVPKPIDFHAHDSQRYSGDILAWVHQACMGEREMLENIFGIQSRAEKRRVLVSMPEIFSNVEGYRATELEMLAVLDKNTTPLVFLLEKRFSNLFESSLGCLEAFKVSNIIQFYGQTLNGLVGPDSNMTKCINLISLESAACVAESFKTQSLDLERHVERPPVSLEVPNLMREALVQLKEILVTYDMSMVGSVSNDAMADNIINAFVEPLLKICENGSQELQGLDSSIYKVNCYHLIQSYIAGFTISEPVVERLGNLISNVIQNLVEEQCQSMLVRSGLAPIVHAFRRNPKPLSECEDSSQKAISNAFEALDLFLLDLTMEISDRLYRIQSMEVVKMVSSQGSLKFLNIYREIVAELENPINNYQSIKTLIRRTPMEVETLLSLHEDSS